MYSLRPKGGKSKFVKELDRISNEFSDPVSARIRMDSTDMFENTTDWWFWQEFGAAEGFKGDPKYGVANVRKHAYQIFPTTKLVLRFPDPFYKYRLPRDLSDPNYVFAWHIPTTILRLILGISHPGYKPKAYIRTILPYLRGLLRKELVAAMRKSKFKRSVFKQDFISKIMPLVLVAIAASMSKRLGHKYHRTDGRLEGTDPGLVFKAAANIVDTSSS